MAQNINFSGSDQIQTPQYPDVHPPSPEQSDEYSKPENPNELFQKLLEDLKELAEYDNSLSKDRPSFLNDNDEESLENSSKEIATSNSNEEKEEPPQDSDIHQLIKECSTEVSEEQKQSMEDTMQELVKICQEKEFLCIHDNVDDLIESALNSKLLLINSQRLEKEQQEVKNVVEQPAERGNHSIESLQNFRVVHKKHEYSPSMGYENSNTTPETKSDEIIKSGVEELVPILSECEVTLEDKMECDVPVSTIDVCDDHSEIFSDFKNDDDILVYDDDFEDIEYVEASLFDPEIVSIEEENVVHQAEENDVEEEEVDLEDISQIQDIVLHEKLLSITRLISNIKSLNDNSTLDRVLNSFEFDNSLLDNFLPEFETFCDHTEEMRSGNTTHADNSFPEYDLFCFEIEPDQEMLINVMKNDVSDDSSNDPLLEEVDLFLAYDNSIPPGIENFVDDSEGDIHFLEELLIDDSILLHESPNSNFEDNPSIPRPPPEQPNAETDAGDEIPVVMNDKDKFDEDYYFFHVWKSKKYSHKPKAEDTNQEKLYLLHMDLCGPMRIKSINGRKYILVIVDDYSRFTWVKFLRSKDEAPENPPFTTPYVPPTKNDWDLLFQPMFDEYFNPPPSVISPVRVVAAPRRVDLTGSPSSTSIDKVASS
nr:Gag-Pol polyprotein [Tanacetum cinerariifolium]